MPLWNVPEAHVGALRLWHNEIELVRHAVDPVHLVLKINIKNYYCYYCYYYLVRGEIHQPVLLLLKANVASGSPLEPQLEDVIVTAALDHLEEDIHQFCHELFRLDTQDQDQDVHYLVSSVVAAVVTLVCLEEVIRRHLIAVDQEILEIGSLLLLVGFMFPL